MIRTAIRSGLNFLIGLACSTLIFTTVVLGIQAIEDGPIKAVLGLGFTFVFWVFILIYSVIRTTD